MVRLLNCSHNRILTSSNLVFDMLNDLAKLDFDVFVPGEAHFGQVVLVQGADGVARHEGPAASCS